MAHVFGARPAALRCQTIYRLRQIIRQLSKKLFAR
jgi:hypothetical protein